MSDPSPPEIITREGKDEASGRPPCEICHRQFSRYTCPSCNIPYCSLICFRSEAHAQCSEVFYKRELEDEIRTQPSKSKQERQQMLEMLKRLEEDSLDDQRELLEGDEDSEDDLAQRLSNVDLDKVSYDNLWELLNESQRERFLKLIQDPSSDKARELLTSEELASTRLDPWWEAPTLAQAEGSGKSSITVTKNSQHRYGSQPPMMEVPASLVNPKSIAAGPPLLYNITAVCIAYAYVSRHLAVSPLHALAEDSSDKYEARQLMSTLVPFLTQKKSRALLGSLEEVVIDVWSRFESITPTFLSLLLGDAVKLLTPLRVTLVDSGAVNSLSDTPVASRTASLLDLKSHPNSHILRVLADVSLLLRERTKDSHETLKLRFYAGYILSIPSAMISTYVNELSLKAFELSNSAPSSSLLTRSNRLAMDAESARFERTAGPGETAPRIEEL